MTPLPFCGQAYADRTLAANAQTCVNFYPVKTTDPDRVVLYPTPGYREFLDTTAFGIAGTGDIRGVFVINDVLYVVSGSKLLKIYADGTPTALGTLATSSGRCSVVCNTVELAISDGSSGYVLNLVTEAFTTVSGGAWPSGGVTNLTTIDSYVLGAANGSKTLVQSDLLAAGTYPAQAFAVVTSFPDNLVGVFSDQVQLYAFGPKLTEVRFDSGATPFAFEKSQGVLIQAGCAAWATVVRAGSSTIWLASDEAGKAYVAALEGYTPKVLSTPPMNEVLERYSNVSDAFAYTYREADSQFYVITFPSAAATWVIDLKTGWVHQRQSPAGGRDYPDHCVLYRGRHLVGGADGKLYWMSQDYPTYTDGSYFRRVRTCQHASADGDTLFLHELQIECETGVGLESGQGRDPLATLEISRDGGRTWVSAGTASLGRIGEYGVRLTWRRLGRTRQKLTFRLTISDPVRTYILGAWARISRGK